MQRSPSISVLRKDIEDNAATTALEFFRTHKGILDDFKDLESYVFGAPEPLTGSLRGFEYHFNVLARRILDSLRQNAIFIGRSVVDDLLFLAIKHSSTPVTEVLQTIRDNGLHHPGFVLYPLHSFGINGVGFIEALSGPKYDLLIPRFGLAVRAQTNELKGTVEFLRRSSSELGVSRKVEEGSLQHYSRNPLLKWLTHNPLLVVKLRSFSGQFYENQAFIVVKLEIATSLLFMLSALETGLSNAKSWSSTHNVNNWETLDLKHYVLLEPKPNTQTALNARRVPMSVTPAELAELASVPINLSVGSWARRRVFVNSLCSALLNVETGYLDAVLNKTKKSPKATVYRKLFMSLSFFRRSFRQTGDPKEALVNVAIAFEILLTDRFERGVEARIQRRLRRALRGIRGNRQLNLAVVELYSARSEVVHEGFTDKTLDLQSVRQAFIHALMFVVSKVDQVPGNTSIPIETIIGVK